MLTVDALRREIEALHRFFVEWFSGAGPASSDADFEREFTGRFDPDFVMIAPSGALLDLEQISSAVHAGRGQSPDFAIEIRNVELRQVFGEIGLCTYEEWQRNAGAGSSTRGNNGRLSTALLRVDPTATSGLAWLHLHETWLAKERVSADELAF